MIGLFFGTIYFILILLLSSVIVHFVNTIVQKFGVPLDYQAKMDFLLALLYFFERKVIFSAIPSYYFKCLMGLM